MSTNSTSFIISNLHRFLEIAQDALAECEKLLASHRRARPDGKPGHVLTYDPKHQSFKQGVIAIAFSGIYLHALLRIEMIRRLGHKKAEKLEYAKYEDKLSALGISDKGLLERTRQFREVRNDVTHEEPIVDGVPMRKPLRWVQAEARLAVNLVTEITQLLVL